MVGWNRKNPVRRQLDGRKARRCHYRYASAALWRHNLAGLWLAQSLLARRTVRKNNVYPSIDHHRQTFGRGDCGIALRTACSLLLLSWWAIVLPAFGQTNTWVQLSPTPASRWVPSSFWDCTTKGTSANPQGRAFSGSVIGNGQIFYFGGSHHSYPSNDVDLYDIATNRWIPDTVQPQCVAACCPMGGVPGPTPNASNPVNTCDNFPVGCNTGTLSPYTPSCLYGACVMDGGVGPSKPAFRCSGGSRDTLLCSQDSDCPSGGTCSIGIPTPGTPCSTCRPYAAHTYQRQVYNPARRKFVMVHESGTWEWDAPTRAWTWLGPPPNAGNGDQSTRLLLWDAPRARLLWFQAAGSIYGVFTFSYATSTWSSVDAYMPMANNGSELYGTWDGHANRVVINMANRWWVYDPTKTGASAWTEVTANTPADLKQWCSAGVRPCFTTAVEYDATNQRTIAMTEEDPGAYRALWSFDATTPTDPNAWQHITTSGGGGAHAGDPVSGYPNQLHYDASTASLYLVDLVSYWLNGTGGTVQTWKITLNLGNPLPTNTPANTLTITPTQPSATPTNTRPSATPMNTQRTATPTITPTAGPTTPTPTCAGTVRLVGPSRTYKKPSDAAKVVQSNDCVYIDAGDYPNDPALWPASASNVTIRGVGGTVRLTVTNGSVNGAGFPTASWSKGIWVVDGANTTIENVEFSCATSRTNNTNCSGVLVGDGNDAGIRLEAPGLTIRNCVFHDNDNGILGGPNVSGLSGDTLIEHSEFFRNGLGDGSTHNVYLNAHHNSVTFRYNYTHGAITGHNFKSRAATNYILYNRIMDETNAVTTCTDGPNNCSASVEIELPCGGLSYVIGNVIEKGSHADSADLVKYAAEQNLTGSGNCPIATTQELYVINNTMVNDYAGTTFFVRGFQTAPLLWAKNNIFWGQGTKISWPGGGTATQANNVIANPQLLSQTTYDYHLTAASTAVIDQGADPGADAHGYNLAPTEQYVYDRQSQPRPSNGALDVGAFEYVAPVTPFSTPTATPSNTPTPSPIWTATPAALVYCSAGQLEAVYSIALSTDDGSVQRAGASYTSLAPSLVSVNGYAEYDNFAIRKNQGSSPYVTQLVAWRWNTATLPDGSAWPVGAQVTGAMLRPFWDGTGVGQRSLIFEWHNWPAPTPLSDADWTNSSVTSSDPTFAATISRPSSQGRQTIALSNAPTNVNRSGYTGMRLTVSDSTPPAANEDNEIASRTRDFLTSNGDQSTQLVICYLAAGGPSGTPTPTPVPNRPHPPVLL